MKQRIIDSLDDLLLTFGLLVLWLFWMVENRQYQPLDVFLYDRGYYYIGQGVWGKIDELRKQPPD